MLETIKNSDVKQLAGIIMLDIEKNTSGKSTRTNINKNLAEKVITYLEDNAQYRVDIEDVPEFPGKVQLTTYKV